MSRTSETELIPNFSCVTMMRETRDHRDDEMDAMTYEERLKYLGIEQNPPPVGAPTEASALIAGVSAAKSVEA